MTRPWVLSDDRPARILRAQIGGAALLAVPFVLSFAWANGWSLGAWLAASIVGGPLMGAVGWKVAGQIRRNGP